MSENSNFEYNKRLTESGKRAEILSWIKNNSLDKYWRLKQKSLDQVFANLEKDLLQTNKWVFSYEKTDWWYYLSYLWVRLDILIKTPSNLLETANQIDYLLDKHYFSWKKTNTEADKDLFSVSMDLEIETQWIKDNWETIHQEVLEKVTWDSNFRKPKFSLASKYEDFLKKVHDRIKFTHENILEIKPLSEKELNSKIQEITKNPSVYCSIFEIWEKKIYRLNYNWQWLDIEITKQNTIIEITKQIHSYLLSSWKNKISFKDKKIEKSVEKLLKEIKRY